MGVCSQGKRPESQCVSFRSGRHNMEKKKRFLLGLPRPISFFEYFTIQKGPKGF